MTEEIHYIVTWDIDIFTDTPLNAAKNALKIHRNKDSIATVFSVLDVKKGETYTIDLSRV